jgi:hypothetical protein
VFNERLGRDTLGYALRRHAEPDDKDKTVARLGHRSIGIEIDSKYIDAAIARVRLEL